MFSSEYEGSLVLLKIKSLFSVVVCVSSSFLEDDTEGIIVCFWDSIYNMIVTHNIIQKTKNFKKRESKKTEISWF